MNSTSGLNAFLHSDLIRSRFDSIAGVPTPHTGWEIYIFMIFQSPFSIKEMRAIYPHFFNNIYYALSPSTSLMVSFVRTPLYLRVLYVSGLNVFLRAIVFISSLVNLLEADTGFHKSSSVSG